MQSTVPISASCLCPPCPVRWPATSCPRHPLLSLPFPPPNQTCQTSHAEHENHATDSSILPRHSSVRTSRALSVAATALHPLQKQSCWARHGTAVWPRTVVPAAPQKDVWKMFLFVFNSQQHLSHAYYSMPVTITELGSPHLWKYT